MLVCAAATACVSVLTGSGGIPEGEVLDGRFSDDGPGVGSAG